MAGSLSVVTFALLLLVTHTSCTTVTLQNSLITAQITDGRLEGISSQTDGPLFSFENDSWSVDVSLGPVTSPSVITLSPQTCDLKGLLSLDGLMNVTFQFECSSLTVQHPQQLPIILSVDVTFDLRTPDSQYVSKKLSIFSSRPWSISSGSFFLHQIKLYVNTSISCASTGCDNNNNEWFLQINPFYTSAHIAAFSRFPSLSNGAFITVTNPFSIISTKSSASCEFGHNHVGDDLAPPTSTDPLSCEQLCQSRSDCAGYVYLPSNCEGNTSPMCFLKSSAVATSTEACPCLASKPFSPSPNRNSFTTSYSPLMAHNASFGVLAHVSDWGIVGLTNLSAYHYSTGVNLAERQAFAKCVDSFLLDPRNETVKVNVAWDENDYQIDVGTQDGISEYNRIFARNAELGITHVVFEPQDSQFSSRFNTTDGWGWEGSLWFTLGQLIREGGWSPINDEVPEQILNLIQLSENAGVKLLAYVYPCLAFEAMSEYVIDGALDLSPPEVQRWMFETLSTFLTITRAGGYAWDHDIFAGTSNLRYAQWRAWMNILSKLRERHPTMVMDHRQTNHMWGPWYQLAGSYAEPIAGDENPESYGVPLTSLHTDHIAANNMRIVNHVYATQQLQPPSRIPGFMFHQTERTADNGTNPCFGGVPECFDSNARDFDLMGYKYSVLSSIGTAGLNNVITMIPARDIEEFTKVPTDDLNFIRNWLQWTDTNMHCLQNLFPIPTLHAPSTGGVDGTACSAHKGDLVVESNVFLFNPAMLQRAVELVCDESIGIGPAVGDTPQVWEVKELYPLAGASLGMWSRGSKYNVTLFGGDVLVLQLSLAKSTTRAVSHASLSSRAIKMNALAPEQMQSPSSKSSNSLEEVMGPMGGSRILHLIDQESLSTNSFTVNGVLCNTTTTTNNNNNNNPTVFVSFGGPSVYRSMPISSTQPEPSFRGGWFNTTFVIPGILAEQLRNRSERYPIKWNEAEYVVAWLVPHRLLMVPFIDSPSDTMKVSLWVDGQAVQVSPAYNSRALPRSSCFMGFFYDASNLQSDVVHEASLLLPSLQANQFQGLFWENVDTIWTSQVESCTVSIPAQL